ncbi:ETX/MTX2 family pore-forming toxin [Brevibacillus laterosporus]|uniref:ETX/MTX2 family pore-forming toxin n=1 Tax=Brevibacillus laterosporus TaxID=1465 RepID=UPI0018CEA943|nr:ETX/MTX2 family pore-forming toxin [Brevibacillus laterosporus]MBG9799203.1 insecticidal toxin MTX2 [Brevibacillus laterosporus]MED1911655.1 ETX/MTX2 family pore-forming toxin [Brevibacillus laterosporus]
MKKKLIAATAVLTLAVTGLEAVIPVNALASDHVKNYVLQEHIESKVFDLESLLLKHTKNDISLSALSTSTGTVLNLDTLKADVVFGEQEVIADSLKKKTNFKTANVFINEDPEPQAFPTREISENVSDTHSKMITQGFKAGASVKAGFDLGFTKGDVTLNTEYNKSDQEGNTTVKSKTIKYPSQTITAPAKSVVVLEYRLAGDYEKKYFFIPAHKFIPDPLGIGILTDLIETGDIKPEKEKTQRFNLYDELANNDLLKDDDPVTLDEKNKKVILNGKILTDSSVYSDRFIIKKKTYSLEEYEQLQKNGKSGRSKRDVSSLDASKKDFSALTPIDEETYTVEGIVTEK